MMDCFIIIARNEIAAYVAQRGGKERTIQWQEQQKIKEEVKGSEKDIEDEPFLPPAIDDERLCNRCYALDACMNNNCTGHRSSPSILFSNRVHLCS